jgi:hypothetical protein
VDEAAAQPARSRLPRNPAGKLNAVAARLTLKQTLQVINEAAVREKTDPIDPGLFRNPVAQFPNITANAA